jgi:hypothetical protein
MDILGELLQLLITMLIATLIMGIDLLILTMEREPSIVLLDFTEVLSIDFM